MRNQRLMVKEPPLRLRSSAQDATPMDAASVEQRLARLSAQFDLLKAQVRQAQQLSSLGTAAATMAHEFSNLLTPILSYAEYAVNGDDTELMKKALTVTAKNTRILVRMCERILELNAASPPTLQSVSIHRVVKDALESLCRDLSKDGITVNVEVDESLTAWADPLQLQQVLFNLLLNAREAMAPAHSGRLAVSARRSGDKTCIRLHNTGPAIPADVLPHIFDALQTTKPGERDGRKRCGGLGLALCRDLVTENGGTIDVTSDDRNGTTFTLSLPGSDPASGSDA